MLSRLVTMVILAVTVDVALGGSQCKKYGLTCSGWDYIDTCGSDCRSFRWRTCEKLPNGDPCDVEDDKPPCWYVEWGAWSECNKDTCTRARSEVCKCNGVTVNNDEICKAWVKTEEEPCNLVPAWTSWSDCDDSCQRKRTPKCMCGNAGDFTDGVAQPFLVNPVYCGLEDKDQVASCDKAVEWSPWADCDSECNRKREASCKCDNKDLVNNGICGLTASESVQSEECDRDWTEWKHKECPAAGDKCVEFIPKYRDCQCQTNSPFLLEDHECRGGASDGSHVCDYGCTCSPAFIPPMCEKKCQGPNIVTSDPPTCECTPSWHEGSCDPTVMAMTETKECPIEPSEWEEWGAWSACGKDSCKKRRTRKCLCYPFGPDSAEETTLCVGSSEEYAECDTEVTWSPWSSCDEHCRKDREAKCSCEDADDVALGFCDLDSSSGTEVESCAANWTPWTNMRCPMQMECQCSVSSKRYRQCQCQEGLNAFMTDAHCVGDSRGEYDCPVEECRCEWFPLVTTCPTEPTCAPQIIETDWECQCTPDWYGPNTKCGGECGEKPEGPSNLCEPTVEYEWTQWGPWGACDANCERRRTRSCSCLGDVDNEACGNGESEQVEGCDTEWSGWIGTCKEGCTVRPLTQTRSCTCKQNRFAVLSSGRCSGSDSRSITCPRKDYELSQWSEWSDHQDDPMMMCMSHRKRDCECKVEEPYEYVFNPAFCEGETEQSEFVTAEFSWTDWSEPECGELDCAHKIRPSYRYCECSMPVGMFARVDPNNHDLCPYERHEKGVKCPQKTDCTTTTRTVFIDEVLTKDLIGVDHAAYEDGEAYDDLEEEPLPEEPEEDALPELETDFGGPDDPFTEDTCVCDSWIPTSECSLCTQEVWRVCQPEGCNVELDVHEGCCEDCDPGYTFDDSLMFEECKKCPNNTFKAERGPAGCKSCPDGFVSNTGSQALSDCRDPCVGCGPWVDVGSCPDGPGTYHWRSSDAEGCAPECPAFECIPPGPEFDPCSTCGQWLDVGPCPDGQPGQYQWRSVDVCDCEEHQCIQNGGS